MRLIHTTTLTLQEFFTEKAPKEYAILSHCWDEDEVTFADFTSGRNRDGYGYKKILDCCTLARRHGFEWAWVDTCCIDKTSSAELTEAINSMFTWYQRSSICYAFLPDYRCGRRIPREGEQRKDAVVVNGADCAANCDPLFDLSRSRWFTRGWTLQELVAPALVAFYDQDGVHFGDKISLAEELSAITKIGVPYLVENKSIWSASIACRMSWASRRTTTRAEDIAYCLLGIFNVNMPLLYGEGRKAFIRLQENILQQSADDSLFAWQSESTNGPEVPRGLLATSPHEFNKSGNIVARPRGEYDPPYRLTNRGIEVPMRRAPGFIRLMLSAIMPWKFVSTRSFELACKRSSGLNRNLVITLQNDLGYEDRDQANRYFRVDHTQLANTRTPIIHWFLTRTYLLSGDWVNHYVAPGTLQNGSVSFSHPPSCRVRWRLRVSGAMAMLGSFLFPVLAALANWKYDNPMLVTAIILVAYNDHLKANVRVIFALVLVLSGNFGIGPSLSATERSQRQN